MCQAITEGRALDVIEVDAASNRGIDEIRELRARVNYAPNEARYKVYIIDEVHMLTKEASNALLKTLEEPPPHIIFILATTEAHKVLPTVLSRCQRFDFRRISQADVVSKLTRICSTEGIHMEPEALRLIARAATGSLRDAENLLEQLTTYYGSKIELQQVQTVLGITGDWRAKELVKHIINNDVSAGVVTISSDEAIDLPAEDITELKDLAAKSSLPQILKAVKLFGQLELGFDNYSTLPLELALVDCTLSPTEEELPSQVEYEPRQPAAKPKPTEKAEEPTPKSVDEALGKAEEAHATVKKAEEQTTKTAKDIQEQVEPAITSEPTPPTAESTPTTPSEPGGEIEQLQANWRQFIRDAPASISRTPAAALLRSAKPQAIDGDTVVLSFKYPLHKENMEKPENQQIAEKIISSFLGHSCRVRCIYEPEDNHLIEEALKIGAQIIDTEEK
jgi:DNA polymerase-3 subunit gamma/tau